MDSSSLRVVLEAFERTETKTVYAYGQVLIDAFCADSLNPYALYVVRRLENGVFQAAPALLTTKTPEVVQDVNWQDLLVKPSEA